MKQEDIKEQKDTEQMSAVRRSKKPLLYFRKINIPYLRLNKKIYHKKNKWQRINIEGMETENNVFNNEGRLSDDIELCIAEDKRLARKFSSGQYEFKFKGKTAILHVTKLRVITYEFQTSKI